MCIRDRNKACQKIGEEQADVTPCSAADASGPPETKLIHNLCVGKHDSIYQRLKSSAGSSAGQSQLCLLYTSGR